MTAATDNAPSCRSRLVGPPEEVGRSELCGIKGFGALSETRAACKAKCPKGSVVFLVEQERAIDDVAFGLTRSLLPAYAAAEAERIGCGPGKPKIMRG